MDFGWVCLPRHRSRVRIRPVGKSSLYATFGSKRRLFLRALAEDCTDIIASAREQLSADSPDARSRLTDFVRTAAQGSLLDSADCLLAKSTAELAAIDDEVVTQAADVLAALHQLIADTVREAQGEGTVHPTMDSSAAASLLLATLRGIAALSQGGCPERVVFEATEQALTLLGTVPTQRALQSN